jgi:membrane-bound serine protease (ClpP class)
MRFFALFLLTSLLLTGFAAGAQPADADGADEPLVYVIDLHGEINRSMMVFLRRGVERATSAGAQMILFDIDTFGGRVDSALQMTSLIGSVSVTTAAYVTSGPDVTGVSWSAGALIAFACDRIYMAPGTTVGAARPVYQGPEGMEMAPEKVVSALRAQMAALAEKNGYSRGVAVAMVDEDEELTEAYRDGELIVVTADELAELERRAAKGEFTIERGQMISRKGKLLTLTAGEMERYGISSGTVSELDGLLGSAGLPEARIVRYEPTVADETVAVMTGSALTTLLIIAGLVALFIEITTPGFGIPGSVAIICFSVVFLSNALLGTADSLEILAFVAGVTLLLVEIFLIPGFGLTGVSGIILIAGALVFSQQDFFVPEFDWQWDLLRRNVLVVFAGVGTAFVVFVVAARFLPRIGAFRTLLLATSQQTDAGFVVQAPEEESSLVGVRGKTITTLRPVGKADLAGEVTVVESEGQYIEPGVGVEVVAVNGNRIVVRVARSEGEAG